jgi:ATP-dependent RNA helicase RhlE
MESLPSPTVIPTNLSTSERFVNQSKNANSFDDLKLIPPLLKALSALNYTQPTPIQIAAIPPLLEGRDVLGCAQTGTGKTAAFLLPILQHLANHPEPGKPKIRGLCLTPTRELAAQIGESFREYKGNLKLSHQVIFGGVNQRPQVNALRNGVDVLVATPGRLLDLHGQGHIDFGHVEFFVLDEADRMLDMGFIHDIRKILALLPRNRQNLLFSATMPDSIVKLARGFLHEPIKVEVDRQSTTVDRIVQRVMFVERANKKHLLKKLLQTNEIESAIVFTRTKHGANKVVKDLAKAGVNAAAIHGNKSQSARTRALAGFKSGTLRILVATDIASRGIDIDGVSHVINYELPNISESYVHRIGRTGRAGREGIAIAFCDESETDYLRDVEKLTGQPLEIDDRHEWHFPDAIPTQQNKGRGRAIQAARKKENQARRGPRAGDRRHSNGRGNDQSTGNKRRGNRGSRGRGRS